MLWIILSVVVVVVIALVILFGSDGKANGKTYRWASCGLVLLLFALFVSVPTGYTGIVTTFGHVENYTLDAGFHVKSPFQEVSMMDNRTQKVSRTDECFSSDIQQVDVTYSVNYNIDKETAMNVREWACPDCGVIHDRDINAAINILTVGTAGIVC